ncbi:hypothetical protein V8E36_004195, partial [Tilletia maclaganii]
LVSAKNRGGRAIRFQRAVSRLLEVSSPHWILRKRWRPLDAFALDTWAGTSTGAAASSSSAAKSAEEIVEQEERTVRREREHAAAVTAAFAQA